MDANNSLTHKLQGEKRSFSKARSIAQKLRRNNERDEATISIFSNNNNNGDIIANNNNFIVDQTMMMVENSVNNDDVAQPQFMLLEDENNYTDLYNIQYTNFDGGGGNSNNIGEDLEEESILFDDNINHDYYDDDDDDDDSNRGKNEFNNNNDDEVDDEEHNKNDYEDDNSSLSSSVSSNYYNETFHIKDEVNQIKIAQENRFNKKNIINNNNNCNNNNKMPLYQDDNINKSTANDLFMFVKNICAKYDTSSSMEKDLFDGIRKYAVPSDSSFHKYVDEHKSGVVEGENERYTGNFDICPDCGDTVYVGIYEHLQECQNDNCKASRYYPCSVCRKNSDSNAINTQCCEHKGRISRKVLFYNYIIPTMVTLIAKPGFLDCLNYAYFGYNNGGSYRKNPSPNGECYIKDVSDGIAFKIAQMEMNQQYQELKAGHTKINNYEINEQTIQVKLMFSLFYDGVQLFKSKVVGFSPLSLTVLNMPPNLRTRQGVGTFLLSAFNSVSDSQAEQFLFNQCLMDEIGMLEQGYAVRLGEVTYLLQARIIQFIFDLPQLEKSLQVQCSKAKSGCGLCYGTYGITRCNRVVYSDIRVYLPWNNIVRSIGQTCNCCPRGYFEFDRNDIVDGKSENDSMINGRQFHQGLNSIDDKKRGNEGINEVTSSNLLFCINRAKREELLSTQDKSALRKIREPGNVIDNQHLLLKSQRVQDMHLLLAPLYFTPCDVNHAHQIKNFLFDYDNSQMEATFFHGDKIPMELLLDSLYYEFANYQEQVRLSRKKSKFYKRNAKIAEQLKVHSYKGVKGKFFGHRSKFVKIELHVNFDPTHTISNIMKYYRLYWMGDKRLLRTDEKLVKLMRQTKCHPSLYDPQSVPVIPWLMKNRVRGQIDAIISSMLIPVGLRGEFEVRSLFVHTRIMKFNIQLDIICVLMPVIMIFGELPVAYSTYFMMFSEAICKLTSPIVDKDELTLLSNQIIEIAALHQGLFPQTEHLIIVHDLIHLAKHIKVAGIWKGWSSISGERFHNKVKSKLQTGGKSFDKTILNKYYRQENYLLRTFFNFNITENNKNVNDDDNDDGIDIDQKPEEDFQIESTSDNKGFRDIIDSNRELVIRYRNDNDKATIFYNPYRMLVYCTSKDLKKKVFLNPMDPHECEDFLMCLIKEVMKATVSEEDACEQSYLFTLYVKHQKLKLEYGSSWYRKNNNNNNNSNNSTRGINVMSFYDFIMILYEQVTARHNKMESNYDKLLKDKILALKIVCKAGSLREFIFAFSYKNQNNDYCIVGEKALIYGRKFSCRGFGFHRKGIASTNDIGEDMINLKNNWRSIHYYNSYCKFRYSNKLKEKDHHGSSSFYNMNNNNPSDNHAFAHLNFFMRIHIPSEELLNGIKLASIDSYITERHELWNTDQINRDTWGNYQSPAMDYIDFNKTYEKNRKHYRFVALTDIFATQYGSFGLDNINNKPFRQEKPQIYSAVVNNYFAPLFSKNIQYNSIQKLYLIPLKSERLNVVYDKLNSAMYNE